MSNENSGQEPDLETAARIIEEEAQPYRARNRPATEAELVEMTDRIAARLAQEFPGYTWRIEHRPDGKVRLHFSPPNG